MASFRYCCLLLWLSFCYMTGVVLFMRGFLLKRTVIVRNSTCDKHDDATHLNITNSCSPPRFSRTVFIIIDGLRYDFARWNQSAEPSPPPFINKLSVIRESLNKTGKKAMLYKFIADPPTTTMQRLKGLVTGSLPTFIDAGANFASYEIKEDNWVDQLRFAGKKIVFMGDDTWGGLFPKRFDRYYPFPSFNVKDLDTVDNGIIERLVPTMKRKDWDVIIAHFLGVDHCGHRYGPNHPAMAQKLNEMDFMLRSVIDNLGDDTLLLVMGDHGMTRSGDHGGDSQDEVTAAMFAYSPRTLHRSTTVQDVTVKQVDLVPTLSLLLGVPIPFANLGTAIADLMIEPPANDSAPLADLTFQCRALLTNVFQVSTYLGAYFESSKEFSQQRWTRLQTMLGELSAMLDVLESALDGRAQLLMRLKRKCIEYLRTSREMCEDVWATFDTFLMACGLAQIALAVFMGFWLRRGRCEILTRTVNVTSLVAACIGFVLIVVFYLEADTYSTTAVVTLIALSVCSITSFSAILCGTRKPKRWILTISTETGYAVCVIVAYSLSLFSNSYVLTEEHALSTFSQSLLWTLLIANPFPVVVPEPVRRPNKPEKKKEPAVKTHQLYLLACALAFGVVVRLALIFHRCPEEQQWCDESNFLRPLSALQGDTAASAHKQWRYFLVTICACVLPFVLYRWLSRAGNLNGNSPNILCVKYCLSVATICTIYYWSLLALPPNLLKRLPPWQQVWVPRATFIGIGATLLSFVLQPLCVYMLPQTLGPVYGKDSSDLIPQVFNHLKLNWKAHFVSPQSKEPPIVYGLGTVYSAGLVVVVSCILLLLMLLLGDGMAPAVLLLMVSMLILAFTQAVRKCKSAAHIVDLFEVSWSSVAAWSLTASFFFFTTGHQAAFPAIQWNTAFIGSEGDPDSHFLPAAKVLLNTFASQFVFSVALPLLAVWPITCNMLFPSVFMFPEKLKEVNRGELVIFHNQDTFFNCLCRCGIDYMTCHGIKLLACMASSAYHRRHLMVWKLFAPRFIFEAATTPFVLAGTMLGFLTMCWIDWRLAKWIHKLESNR